MGNRGSKPNDDQQLEVEHQVNKQVYQPAPQLQIEHQVNNQVYQPPPPNAIVTGVRYNGPPCPVIEGFGFDSDVVQGVGNDMRDNKILHTLSNDIVSHVQLCVTNPEGDEKPRNVFFAWKCVVFAHTKRGEYLISNLPGGLGSQEIHFLLQRQVSVWQAVLGGLDKIESTSNFNGYESDVALIYPITEKEITKCDTDAICFLVMGSKHATYQYALDFVDKWMTENLEGGGAGGGKKEDFVLQRCIFWDLQCNHKFLLRKDSSLRGMCFVLLQFWNDMRKKLAKKDPSLLSMHINYNMQNRQGYYVANQMHGYPMYAQPVMPQQPYVNNYHQYNQHQQYNGGYQQQGHAGNNYNY